MKEQPELLAIVGPTASGKTACAVAFCRIINGEVVSADSMQIYRGMDILTAKPDIDEMGEIVHHMIGFADPAEKYTASMYRERAKEIIEEIRSRKKYPVLCGGTGLYVNALTRPMSFSQRSDEILHRSLMSIADEPGGLDRLHRMLEEVDPESARRLHRNDVRRVVRALEIFQITGVTQTEQNRLDAQRDGDYSGVIFALEWPRDVLYERISRRVDEMIERGLIDEVGRLMLDEKQFPTAAQAIGYKEIAGAIIGGCSLKDAVEQVKQATKAYAKRQMTWFRNDPRTKWISAIGKSSEEIAQEIFIQWKNQ